MTSYEPSGGSVLPVVVLYLLMCFTWDLMVGFDSFKGFQNGLEQMHRN